MADTSTKLQNLASQVLNPITSLSTPGPVAGAGKLGQGTLYQSEKYRLKTHQYPEDLFGNAEIYGNNYVVFYINVPADSKLIKEGKVEVTDRDTTAIGSAIVQAGITGEQAITGTTAAVLGLGKLLGFDVGGSALAGFAGSALVAGKSSYGTDKDFLKSPQRQNRRITETITLNVPNNLSTRYSMNYADEDMAAMTAMSRTKEDVAKFVENAQKGHQAGGALEGATQATMNSELAAAIAGGVLQTPGVGSFLSASTGMAANPKKEQVFKGVDFRTFSFEYVFAPRSKNEAQEVYNIINTFKLHMHPEFKDANGYLFLYPSEFDIVYYQGREENMNLPRHTSAVLVEMSVNYTPNSAFNTFDDGSATQINVTLVFKELAILTKAEILDGF